MAATIHFILRNDKKKKNGESPIYLRIIKNRRVSNISTGLTIANEYWDQMKQSVKPNYPNHTRLNRHLHKLYVDYLDKILDEENKSRTVSITKIKKQITGNDDPNFFEIAQAILERYRQNKQKGTYDRVSSILKKLSIYNGSNSLKIRDIDKDYLKKYELFLKTELGNKINTVNKNLKFIKQVFSESIKNGIISYEENPFKHIKLKTEVSTKEFLTEEEIKRLIDLKLPENSKIKLHRDMFVFSCFAGGLRISDVLTLRWSNIKNGHIYLMIRKTHTPVGFKLPNMALDIISNYLLGENSTNDLVFPAVTKKIDPEEYILIDKSISSATAQINKNLKLIASQANIEKRLSFHSSRHSFAVNALKKGIRLEYVSKIMGHSTIRETQGYAKIIDSELDGAMEKFNEME